MGGYLLLGAFLGCGVVFSEALLRSRCGLIRLWFGLVIGLIMMMWSPIPFAFAMRFTHITDDFDKGLDVTFHPADNKHLLRLAVDDVVNGSTVLTKRDNAARVFFHVRLDTL